MKRHFDAVIANPPYANGNAIVKNLVDSGIADEYIILMPFSKYRASNLYKHVTSLSLVDPKAFKDAAISDNLCVCRLTEEEIEREFVDLEIETFNQDYREFYELNFKLKESWKWKTISDRKMLEKLCEEGMTFFLTVRTILDGVHTKESSQDIQANLYHKIITDCLDAITFNTKEEKENIQRWWYSSDVASKLCWATRKQGGIGTRPIFLPRIDWSIDRDYEHLTYEEILAEMRERA